MSATSLYAPAKWHMTAEAADDITGVQEYVAALATHDLCCADAVHAVAAFDLAPPYVPSTNLHVWETGFTDWRALWSPSQMHVWSLTPQLPLSWANEHQMLAVSHTLTMPAVPTAIAAPDVPPAIPVVLRLRGGGKRARSTMRAPDAAGGTVATSLRRTPQRRKLNFEC